MTEEKTTTAAATHRHISSAADPKPDAPQHDPKSKSSEHPPQPEGTPEGTPEGSQGVIRRDSDRLQPRLLSPLRRPWQSVPDGSSAVGGLAAALEAAALAHTLCAEADRRVAAEYEKINRVMMIAE